MPDATIALLCSDATYNIEAIRTRDQAFAVLLSDWTLLSRIVIRIYDKRPLCCGWLWVLGIYKEGYLQIFKYVLDYTAVAGRRLDPFRGYPHTFGGCNYSYWPS